VKYFFLCFFFHTFITNKSSIMHKKLLLLCIAALGPVLLNAQALPKDEYKSKISATEEPSQEWNDWFNGEVEKFIKAQEASRTSTSSTGSNINYRIPVIFHVVHFGQALGTFPNIDSNEIKTQFNVLNNDFAGTGFNVNLTPAPFQTLVANSGISFCRARKDPGGNALTEHGIHRVNANSNGWANPTATTNLVSYINNVIKPNNMWDPTKYLNIWVSDKASTVTINSYATYPAGTLLNGLPTSGGTANDDGIWIYAAAVGTLGSAVPPHNLGRTLTREVGHWLGLRNLWGDGNCLTDYCSDTPWQKQANSGFPPYPSYVNRCGPGQSPFGEMTMNFMDETIDSARWMFTPNQVLRMQTAMSQGTYRYLLGTHNLCTLPTLPPAAPNPGFYFNTPPCVGQPISPINTTTGWPTPNYQWNTAPTATIHPAPSVPTPAFIFGAPGTYTIYLSATNTVNIASYSLVVTTTTCAAEPLCIDTIRRIQSNDTLIAYRAPNSNLVQGCQAPNFAGYLVGSNCFKDKEFAQWIPGITFSAIPFPQINSVIVLFDSIGTKSTPATTNTPISLRLYGGTASNGPNTQFAIKTELLGNIAATYPKTKNVKYVGVPTYTITTTKMIPYKFDFAAPIVLTTNSPGYYIAVETPYQSPGDSISIMCNTKTSSTNDSTSWVLQNPSNNWRSLRYARNARVQLAMLPIMTCRPAVGIQEVKTEFNSNIAVVPNPNNGVFGLVFTLPQQQKINLSTYNAIGQLIGSDQLENVGRNVINIDLSSRPAGVYFIHISNGSEKTVKKVIVAH
jgi:hypothetical protein